MERGRIEGITTSKDVFKAIINTRTLIPDLFSVSGQPQMEQRTLFDQFSDYWFSDVLPKR